VRRLKTLQKFLSLTPAQRLLFIRTAILITRLLVESYVSSRRSASERLSRRLVGCRSCSDDSEIPSPIGDQTLHQYMTDVLRFVTVFGSRVKRVNCLIQGFSAFTLLGQKKVTARLHIGVAKPRNGEIKAHAWLQADGRVVLGGEVELGEFTPIACFSSRCVQG
jgi:hypothetical protein